MRFADDLLGADNGFILMTVCIQIKPLLRINKQFWQEREEDDRDQEAEAGERITDTMKHRLVSDLLIE